MLHTHSSDIDWCEPNYVWSSYIVEFWNSISNAPMVVIAIIQMFLFKNYAKVVPTCENVWIFWMFLMLTGIGSAYFHSTLSLLGQLIDELGILWTFSAGICFCIDEKVLPKMLMNRCFYRQVVATFAVLTTALTFLKPEVNHVLLFFLVPPTIWICYATAKWQKNTVFRYLIKKAVLTFVLAIVFWVLDSHLCSFWLKINFPYLHTFWHVLVTFGAYEAFVAMSFCYADFTVPEKKPQLTTSSLKNFGLPFISLWHVSFSA